MTTIYTPRPLTRAPSACVQGGTHAQVLCWTNVPRCEGCGAVCHLQAQNIWLHVELNGEKIIWDVGLSSLSITSGTREHKNVNLTSFHHPGSGNEAKYGSLFPDL